MRNNKKKGGKMFEKENNKSKKRESIFTFFLVWSIIGPLWPPKKSAKNREEYNYLKRGKRFVWVAIIYTPVYCRWGGPGRRRIAAGVVRDHLPRDLQPQLRALQEQPRRQGHLHHQRLQPHQLKPPGLLQVCRKSYRQGRPQDFRVKYLCLNYCTSYPLHFKILKN